MRIVAIDPGTKCGWAVSDGKGPIISGVWDLKPRRHEGGGMRYLRFRRHLFELLAEGADLVVYEEVRRHLGTDAAHVYGGLVAHLQAFCESKERPVPYEGVPVGTIKKFATGKGNAPKDRMVESARLRWPEIEIADDNEADALWLLDYARKAYEEMEF